MKLSEKYVELLKGPLSDTTQQLLFIFGQTKHDDKNAVVIVYIPEEADDRAELLDQIPIEFKPGYQTFIKEHFQSWTSSFNQLAEQVADIYSDDAKRCSEMLYELVAKDPVFLHYEGFDFGEGTIGVLTHESLSSIFGKGWETFKGNGQCSFDQGEMEFFDTLVEYEALGTGWI